MRNDARIWLDKSGEPTNNPATGNFDFPPSDPPRHTRLNVYRTAGREIIVVESLAQARVYAGRRGLIVRSNREGPATHEFPTISEA